MMQAKIFAVDWATKKALNIYNGKKNKVLANSEEEFEKFLDSLGDGAKESVANQPTTPLPTPRAIFLFEFGGGESFKIMAYRAGHMVIQVPGKAVKEYRDAVGEKKSDATDARMIRDLFISKINDDDNGGSATTIVANQPMWKLPSPFYLFQEQDASLAELKILFRQHEDLKKEMVREKLKKISFARKFKIARVADDRVKKILSLKDASIEAKEKEVEQIKKILAKKIEQFPVWNNYLKNVKAVGPVIASGLIGELGGKKFDSKESLKHYAGMVPKKEHHSYNRFLKAILYQFAEGVIKHKTPIWRGMYDSIKLYYQKKHEDWSRGKVNSYAKKFIETKFLLEFYGRFVGGAGSSLDNDLK